MSYLKLLKLLYLADREAFLRLGRPITYDRYCSMKEGPVLSRTYDLIRYETPPDEKPSYWRQHISEPLREWEVELRHADPPHDQLSAAELSILDDVFKQWGRKSRWDVRDYTHTLPEYKETTGSIPIQLRDILLAQGFSEEDARAVIEEMWEVDQARQLLG